MEKQENNKQDFQLYFNKVELGKPKTNNTIQIYDKKTNSLITEVEKIKDSTGLYIGRYKRVQSAFSA